MEPSSQGWDRLGRRVGTGWDAKDLAERLVQRSDLVFSRAFDDPDTHFAVQFIADQDVMRSFEKALTDPDIRHVRSKEELSALLLT